MKVTNANSPGERAHGIVRGHTDHRRSGVGLNVEAGGTTGRGIWHLTVIGGTLVVNSDGTAVLTIGDTPGVPVSGDYLLKYAGEGHAIYADGGATGTVALDLGAYNVFDIALDGPVTIAFVNVPASGEMREWLIHFRGNEVVTWPDEVTHYDSATGLATTAPAIADRDPAALTPISISSTDGASFAATMLTGAAAAGSLDALSDVTITSPQENDTLRYIGGEWVNDDRYRAIVTDGFDTLVWEGDDLVWEWST